MATTVIRIPTERADQLTALALHKGQTVSALVGDLVAEELDRLGLLEKIGLGKHVEIVRLEDDTVQFAHKDFGTINWTAPIARGVADTIDEFSVPGGPATQLNLDANIFIHRRGTGVTITNLEKNRKLAMASTVAADFARVLRLHAA